MKQLILSLREMEKPSPQITNHRKCQVCQTETYDDCSMTDVANYSAETGNLAMVSRLACHRCRDELVTIRHFVQENRLVFGRESTMAKETVGEWVSKGKDQVRDEKVHSGAFLATIQESTKRSKLYHCVNLPQNCLQLVYYSSLSVNHAERHERIKNAIINLYKVAPIPLGNLEDVAILVHCLSCFMHEDKVINLMKVVCLKGLLQGSPFKQEQTEGKNEGEGDNQLPYEILWKKLYSSGNIGNILYLIYLLLGDWQNFQRNLQVFAGQKGYWNMQKVRKIVPNPVYTLEQNGNGGCEVCKKYKSKSLVHEASIKNQFSLTLKYLISEDLAMKQYISQIQSKFSKEKEEFINKIIKLKDKIQIFEKNNQQQKVQKKPKQIRRARSSSQFNPGTIFPKQQLENISEKSEATSFTKEPIDQNLNCLQTQKASDKEKVKMMFEGLQRMLVGFPDFDPGMLSIETDEATLLETIQISVKNMRLQLDQTEKKKNALESQSKRLLTILTRKQQRFVPLIHEKDEIIEKYENALWKMQHGLHVEDPILGPRISSIISAFKKSVIIDENRIIEKDADKQVALITPKKKNKQKKMSLTESRASKKETNQNVANSKSQQKQCNIF